MPAGQKLAGWALLAGAILLLFAADHFDTPPHVAHRKLLVTSDKVTDPRFAKSVILVLTQEKHSSLGLILNQPAAGGGFTGGPMEQDKWIYALHTLDATTPETKHLNELGLGVVVGQENIDRLLAQNPPPKWSRVLKGYCGWSKRQLARDLDDGYWDVIDFDARLVMETPPEKMWEEAASRLAQKP